MNFRRKETQAPKAASRDANPCLTGLRGRAVPPSRAAGPGRMLGSAERGAAFPQAAQAAGRPAAARALLSPFMSVRGRELPARGRGP